MVFICWDLKSGLTKHRGDSGSVSDLQHQHVIPVHIPGSDLSGSYTSSTNEASIRAKISELAVLVEGM